MVMMGAMGRYILEQRYLMRDRHGQVIETPEDLFRRVARAIAQVDEEPGLAEERFYEAMTRQEFMPNSPTLMNAGRPGGILPGCFVLPLEDSLEGIYDTKRVMVRILQAGGGVGMSFGRLRPTGDPTTHGGFSTGPVSFLRSFSNDLEVIARGGRRRGAGMAILPVWHPDVQAFIACKSLLPEALKPARERLAALLPYESASEVERLLLSSQIPNFNLSVAVTDDFMAALEADHPIELRNPRSMRPTGRVSACALWEQIIERAWTSGDPGLFFVNRANARHPLRHIGQIEATNPCGEQPLLPYESCNLGSINLGRFVSGQEVAWERLGTAIDWAVKFLDNVIDVTSYPDFRSEAITLRNRKIGLGVMGFADMLVLLGIPYDSQEGVSFGRRLMTFIEERAHEASRRLAEIRGVFPHYYGSDWEVRDMPLRNGCTTTIAPTGTISLFADCFSGLEPIFALAYRRFQAEVEMPEVYAHFERVARERGFYSEALMAKVMANQGSCRNLPEVPEDVRRVFVTAHDIAPEWHVRMQAVFQAHVDSGVSKTINLPPDAPVSAVENAYRLAWELGCKGITVYREGARAGQVLTAGAPRRRAHGGPA